jgi:hypothetical protein
MSNPSAPPGDSASHQTAIELAAVKGQLITLTQLMAANHGAIQQRLQDFQQSNERRFSAIEAQIATLTANERGTALRTAGLGAAGGGVAGAIAAAALKLFNLPGGGGG